MVKSLSKRLPKRRSPKKSRTTLVIKSEPVHSILGQQNRFFKHEVEDAEMALFFR